MDFSCSIDMAATDPRLAAGIESRDLAASLVRLVDTERAAGHLHYDPAQLDHYRYTHPRHGFDLSLQINPRRADRPFGSADCPVCLATLQRTGHQRYLGLRVNGRRYFALANPWPALPAAVVIVSGHHLTQELTVAPDLWGQSAVERAVADLAALALALPGFTVIFNGRGAGASLEHFHFQAFATADGQGPLPVQQVLNRYAADPQCWLGFAGDYPLAVHVARGPASDSARTTCHVAHQWYQLQGRAATANLLAFHDDGGLAICFVPRNRHFRVGLLGGALGAIEAAGLAICSSSEDHQRIRAGMVDFNLLWNSLACVQPAGVAEWRAACCRAWLLGSSATAGAGCG